MQSKTTGGREAARADPKPLNMSCGSNLCPSGNANYNYDDGDDVIEAVRADPKPMSLTIKFLTLSGDDDANYDYDTCTKTFNSKYILF